MRLGEQKRERKWRCQEREESRGASRGGAVLKPIWEHCPGMIAGA